MYLSNRRGSRVVRRARRDRPAARPAVLSYPLGLGDDIAWPRGGANTEYWRSLVESYAGDIPVNFLLAWIDWESGGNPCSYTSMGESGIFQLMPPDNIIAGGTSVAALRAACSGGVKTRALTSDEEAEQVRSGVQYVNYVRAIAHSKLDAAGVTWDESSPDFWKFVKLQHNYPGPTAGWLASATSSLGYPPPDWDSFRQTISGYVDILNNADVVGQWGAGGGSLPIMKYAMGGLIAWGLYQILFA